VVLASLIVVLQAFLAPCLLVSTPVRRKNDRGVDTFRQWHGSKATLAPRQEHVAPPAGWSRED